MLREGEAAMSITSVIGTLTIAGVLAISGPAPAGEGQGRSSRLTGPEGSEARGNVVLNARHLIVNVEGLEAGEYAVLLDDGTGAKVEIGKITITAPDAGDDGEGDGAGVDEDEGEDEEKAGRGSLKLSGESLPFGASSPADLGGRAICVKDAAGNVVLSGTTPTAIRHEPKPRNGKCPLSRPDPAVDEDAEGVLKLESSEGRIVIKVHLSNLEAGKLYDVVISNLDNSASESLGTVTANADGNAQFKIDSHKGDAIPFGAGDLAALEGFGVAVKDEAGAAVLVGTICEAQVRGGDGEGHGPPGDKPPPVKPRCFTATLDGASEVPPVETQATGSASFELGRRDGSALHYSIVVEGLSGPATAAHIHPGAAGETNPPLVTLDHETLRGTLELTAEQVSAITAGPVYVNVHTEANAGGEIRGQLVVCADDDDDGEEEEEEEEEEDGEEEEEDEEEGDAGAGGAIDDPMFVLTGEFDTPFFRGDANSDTEVDIADAVLTLNFLFLAGQKPLCLDAADTNDDGRVDITDPIGTLSFLFLSGSAPAAPGFLIPGSDPTADRLFCEEAQ
jgi:hypothetical protein